jgi:hypothetical protein
MIDMACEGWSILTNYGYGWEEESRYTKDDYKDPYESAVADAKEYRLAGARVKLVHWMD